jgi:hypothetical protein
MVKRAFEQEFAATGVKGVKEKVQQGAYEPTKQQQALKWLSRRDPTRKAWRASKNTLELARRTSRQMRITLGLSVISVGLLGCYLHAVAHHGTAAQDLRGNRCAT